MTWLAIILGLYLLWVGSTFYHFYINYLSARKTGLPLIILPISHYNPIWMILSVPIIQPLAAKLLPEWLFEPIDVATYGWEFRRGYSIFEKYGPAFILVTASSNELSLIDPEFATEVLKRIKDFPQTVMAKVIMDIFGPSLLTTDGEAWARQRKLIAPNVNEKISGMVFGESIRQAQQMLSAYVDELKGVTDDTMRGCKQVAMNILGLVGFGITLPWKEEESKGNQKGYRMTYMKATKTVVENLIESAVMPAKLLTLPVFASSWQDIGHAKNEFPLHSKEMLENEKKLQAESSEARNNLMSMMVRLSDSSRANGHVDEKNDGTVKNAQVLSQQEIIGNLFIFTSAGFDTTANTMAYALALLTAYPKWQDWLHEEIKEIVRDRDMDRLEYNEVFPRLPRCLALMLETMRLFTPLTHIAKQTNPTYDVEVKTSSKTYFLPKGTIIYISTVGLHLDPSTFGADASEFNPSRWLNSPSIIPSTTDPDYTIATQIKNFPKGTYLPWSSGPRVCPGQKMAQVEFVTVFMTIFGRYRCEAVRRQGESDEEVKSRIEAIMKDSAPKLTLQMTRNRDLQLRWVER
ncbi:hypothetical protein H2200_001465 [Cladophialophora chaetospira]|uniref:Cytochrome P450 n=1 Tax=Cladophialophora chaetospira TaxID=386627 RepID=A0AA38XL76_9EURO|nr:hypothetical protein H2200_001465 [Cladophialophora chaetospira]